MSDVAAQGGYDPDANPRSLRTVTDAAREEYEAEKAALQRAIDSTNRRLAMHRSQGWKDTALELQAQLGHAIDALASDELNTLEAVVYVRGQIRAFQYLLGLEQRVLSRREAAQLELQALRSAGGEEVEQDGSP